jgi:uncharacterized protein (DUF1697 family)
MALVVFLRGINVGGHRRFRPSILASELSAFDVVNIGAAGTLVVRRPGAQAKFRAELLRRLPADARIAVCAGRDLLRLEQEHPFGTEQPPSDTVRFVSILSKAGRCASAVPFTIPPDGEWFVRVMAANECFVCGLYRRHMKTIGYLGQIDKLFGALATTRNWNTILAVVRILKASADESARAGGVGKATTKE